MSETGNEISRTGRDTWVPRPTLPGSAYHSAETWEQEKERVFASGWICVGREEEVGEAGFVVRPVAEESVVVARSSDGALHGFYNVCAHRGTRLLDGEGTLRSGAIVCPYHSWTYSAAGSLLATPNVAEDERFSRADYRLRSVALETWHGFVFVNLAQEPESLRAYLGRNHEDDPTDRLVPWGLADLRIAHRIVYDIAANWKILVENYSECLHCPGVHPELVRLIPQFGRGEIEDDTGALLADGATTLTLSGTTTRPPLPGLAGNDLHVYLGNTIFPTLMINLHPDCVMTYRLEPLGPARTRIVSEFLFHPETIAGEGFDPGDIAEFWDLVSEQDWAVCERVQTGVGSRAYAAGGVYPVKDSSVAGFNDRYRASMG
ncbi:MAG: aromatic ring-hydroxylating dioxygenase subunit alpha [Actinomycetota bacterium]